MPIATGHGQRDQTRWEEAANSASHALMALAGVAASPALLEQHAALGLRSGLAAAVYCASLVMLFAVSAAYHLLDHGRAKRALQRMDHASIFVFIAGSYTPFMVGPLWHSGGAQVLSGVWTIAALGVIAKLSGRMRHPLISLGSYLGMGFLAIAILDALLRELKRDSLLLVFGGALAYVLGAIAFHFDHRVRFGHLLWHVLVIVGAALHFLAITSIAHH